MDMNIQILFFLLGLAPPFFFALTPRGRVGGGKGVSVGILAIGFDTNKTLKYRYLHL